MRLRTPDSGSPADGGGVSEKTSIEWTDKSSNPLRAYHVETGKRGWFCVHVSPGCANCYAEGMNLWVGNGLEYSAQNTKLVRFEMDVEELRSWQRLKAGTKVFPFDMTDLFQDGVPDALIDQAFAAMGTSPATFQVLTKRAARLRSYVPEWYRRTQSKLLPNVWLGVSVEDQQRADERIPLLLQTPAAVRFVSYEPALGPVDFDLFLPCRKCRGRGWYSKRPFQTPLPDRTPCEDCLVRAAKAGAVIPPGHYAKAFANLDWVIVGGEGRGSRPFDLAWARSVVAQCKVAGVACFVKQLGSDPVVRDGASAPGYPPGTPVPLKLKHKKGGDIDEFPADLRVREFPAVRM